MLKWICLAHIKPNKNNDILEGAKGAFVPAVGLANNEKEFCELVLKTLESYSFTVLELEDIELFENRISNFDVDPEIKELAYALSSRHLISFSTFDAYEKE